MKKFDVFVRKPKSKKWKMGCKVLTYSKELATAIAVCKFPSMWVKVAPSIVIV